MLKHIWFQHPMFKDDPKSILIQVQILPDTLICKYVVIRMFQHIHNPQRKVIS